MSADLANLSRKDFLTKYGHLRPGTYDVLSPRYDEAPDRYFTWPQPSAGNASVERPPFALSPAGSACLEAMLKEHGLGLDVSSLFDFIKSAIEGREYSKFIFTRNLSDAMSLLAGFAHGFGISRDDVAYADINVVHQLYGTSDDPADLLRRSIKAGRRSYEVTQCITLPPLITSEHDVSAFELPLNEPNFITMKSFTGKAVREDVERERLRGAVLMIPSADPGYDWIFSHGIGSFITKYGGANSHMAVRAGELGIPAVIGAGELLYRKWMDARVLEVDCANHQVHVLR
jgi:phosphohistidine swiveling domain-containing protein